MQLRDDLVELEHYVEAEHFVEYMGEIYCVKDDCSNCKYKNECESVEADIECSLKTPVRFCVGVDNETVFENDDAYLYGLDIKQLKQPYNLWNHRFLDNTGYLPESRFAIHKIVQKPETEKPYIIFNDTDKKHYCIRQVCSECEHKSTCKPEIVKEKRQYITVALDLRSQEPRANTYVTKEPNWIKVFQNDSLRAMPDLFLPINNLFTELGVDIEHDPIYWTWLDKMFFIDKTVAYNYYNSTVKAKGGDEKDLKQFEQDTQDLIENFEQFKQELKQK